MLKCPPCNQQKLKFQANEKDEATDRSEMKEQSALTAIKQTTAQSYFMRQETIKAELIWALEVIMSNYLYRSFASKSGFFLKMFNDSEIAKEFSFGKTKVSYNICYGLAPYFRGIFIDSLEEFPFYSLSFDESYNNVLKRKKWIYMSYIGKILKIML